MRNKRRNKVIWMAALSVSAMLCANGTEAAAQSTDEVLQESTIDSEEGLASLSVEEELAADSETELLETEQPEEAAEEILVTEEASESEEELVLEPEYQPKKDPNPLVNQVQQSFEKKEKEQIHPLELPDPEWIAINGEKASCTSFARLQYGYTPEVQVGTIRYISQLSGSTLFDWSYWGGWGNQAGIECGTASISMALSYVGVNLTPQQILDAHGGLTSFTGWSVTDLSPDVAGGVEQYVNGRGQYSPVIVHLPTYSQLGHYVVLIGKVSDTEYLVLDCAQDTTWVMSVYSDFYNSIDQVYQYYNPDAPMLDHDIVHDKPVMATCTSMGLTSGEHCQVCGEVLNEQKYVPASGHVWSDWVTKEEPTTEKSGEKVRVCQVCGQEDTRKMEQLPQKLEIVMPEWTGTMIK